MGFLSTLFGGKKKLSAEVIARDIKQFLSIYETMPRPGSTESKMTVRIMTANELALKSELKEAIAKLEFKEAIENDLFEYLVYDQDFDAGLVRKNVSLVEASADRIISSLKDDIERKLSE